MLPEGFRWVPRWQYDRADTAVECAGVMVAYLDCRITGQWFAALDVHKDGPLRHRDCTSEQTGRAGCEVWVARHAVRLRQEAEAKAAARAAKP